MKYVVVAAILINYAFVVPEGWDFAITMMLIYLVFYKED